MHMKDTMMDIVITLALKPSCLLNATKDSDFAIRVAKSVKFRDDARSRGPIQSSATRRMIPVALDHLVLRGGHFSAIPREFVAILVTRPSGCSFLKGAFALLLNGALNNVLNTWGSRLTWTAQREHATQIVGAMDSFYASSHFLTFLGHTAEKDGGLESTTGWHGG